jgi:electron transfer flavoprotein beta subunit
VVLRIIVLVKQVPATENVKIDEETGTMVRSAMEAVINPFDLYAVEAAVRIKEQNGEDVQVSVLSMGPLMAADAVREAIAMGCDEGFLISGKEFAGSDTWATAYALAKGITVLGEFDIVLCGERATDGETGQVGPMVGTFLDIPVLTYVSGIDRINGEEIVACRVIEGGYELVQANMPVLISVVKEINEPRLPTLAGKIQAREAKILVLDPADINAENEKLGLSGSPTRVVKIAYPTITRTGEIVSVENSSVETCVERLVDFPKAVEIL